MAEEPTDNLDQAEQVDSAESPPSPLAWSQVWQMPALLAGVVMLALGAWLAIPRSQPADFPGTLESAREALELADFELAAQELQKVGDKLDEAPIEDQATYWLLSGDLNYLQPLAERWDKKENHENVLDYYDKARELGLRLDAERLERFIISQIALGNMAGALQKIDKLKDQPAQRRADLIKRIIEHQRGNRALPLNELSTLMARFDSEVRLITEPNARFREELWATRTRVEATLAAGDPQQAIDRLTQPMARFLAEGRGGQLAPLYLLMAKARQQMGEFRDARVHFLKAQELVGPTDALNADMLVGLGQLELSEFDNVQAALELFTRATTEFPSEEPYLDALLGRGDCEAKLGWHPAALEHMGEAVTRLSGPGAEADPRRQKLIHIIRSHFTFNRDKDDYERALDYLSLLRPLYREMPAEEVVLFALAHERLAEQQLAQANAADESDEAGGGRSMTDAARAALFREAALHFRQAAEHYYQHAMAVSVSDDAAHGRSLWQAAECYDRAHLWKQAIDVYGQFVETRASDERFLTAIQRLGLAFLADGQPSSAIDKFRLLVEHHPQAQAAFESLVPLARSYVAAGEFEQAKRVLQSVVDGHPAISPESREYRAALIDLATLHFRLEEFTEAVARFDTAVARYGQTAEGPGLRFYLADAYRRSVRELDAKLQEPLQQSVEQVHRQERVARLKRAADLYRQVIGAFEEQAQAKPIGALDELLLRNAYFYRADCAYALENWDEAISLYDEAAKRWEKHPASLVALIQIVNAYAVQDKTKEAKIANDRARFQYQRLPEDAFNDPTLPMTREHWRQWLYWTSKLDLFDAQASAAP